MVKVYVVVDEKLVVEKGLNVVALDMVKVTAADGGLTRVLADSNQWRGPRAHVVQVVPSWDCRVRKLVHSTVVTTTAAAISAYNAVAIARCSASDID